MTDQELFFDHWFIGLIGEPKEIVRLNGKYEDFLKSHAEHFKAREREEEEDNDTV